jgi:hypothetical protein
MIYGAHGAPYIVFVARMKRSAIRGACFKYGPGFRFTLSGLQGWTGSLIMAISMPGLLTLLTLLPLVCLAGEPRSLTRSIDPIEISGSEVSVMTGTEISSLRVFASRNGKLTPIPFQIDQKNAENDWVWSVVPESSGVNEWFGDDASLPVYSQKDLTHDDQDPHGRDVFDANDVVVFIVKDAGDQDRDNVMRLGADRLVELEISDPVADQGKGWVYLAWFESNAPALSDIRYVRYEPDKFRVSGPEHEFLRSPNHTMVLDDFRLGGVSVLAGNRILGEVAAGIGPITLDTDFSEKTIQGHNAGYINGPVRIVKRSVGHIRLGLGIASPAVNCDHFHYPWHAETPVLISKRFPVRGVSILATSIFRGSKFTLVEVDGVVKPIVLGTGSTQGNLLTENPDAEWIELAGKGISVVTSVKIPEEHRGHLDISPWLADIRDTQDIYNAKSVSGIEAGFLIRTTDTTPVGDHILYNIILFAVNPNRKEFLANAIKLLQQKLIINPVTLGQ